jgi:hypothetical protein
MAMIHGCDLLVLGAAFVLAMAAAAGCCRSRQTPPPAPAAGEALRLHPENTHYFLFRGRPAVLVTSGEHYGAVLNLDLDYTKYLDEIAACGLNLTRTFSGSYREIPGSFGITDNTLAPLPNRFACPWARSATPGYFDGGAKFDLSKFDDATFARLKDFLSQASKRGIVVELSLFCPMYDENLWKANPMNAANNVNGVGRVGLNEPLTLKNGGLLPFQDALVRKIVTECNAFDNLYYEICNEPYFGGVTLDWQAHVAEVIVETEKALPKKHLIAQNIANGSAKIEKPSAAVSISNFHYATPPDTVALNFGLGKALADDETGFKGKDDFTYRGEGWDFILAGGAVYSSLDYSFTPKTPEGTLADYKSPGGGSRALRSQLKILKGFLEGFDFVHMASANALVKGGVPEKSTARVLAQVGKAYAAYVRWAADMKEKPREMKAELVLDLPRGDWKADWVNTKTGAVDKTESFSHTGGPKTLASPAYDEDIALRIGAAPGR